ncbi:MAG: type II toxin-antitoxin system VapC family toxin [Gemmatales bacterium]
MLLLDTDHITILQHASGERFERLRLRLQAVKDVEPVCVSIISIEEQMRGWMSVIAKERKVERQILSYRELGNLFTFYARFQRLPFEQGAARQFADFRSMKIKIGTMDLKIAAIAKVEQAKVLSANLSDFRQVPGLQVENWLDS